MRRKIKHSKRYKDYPKNVPRKLLKAFFSLSCSVSRLAEQKAVNSGVISALLNDGKEPKNKAIRERLGLKAYSICLACGRRIIGRSTQTRKEQPEHMRVWKKLPTSERQKVIMEYIKWLKRV